jgi:hypothetical protein
MVRIKSSMGYKQIDLGRQYFSTSTRGEENYANISQIEDILLSCAFFLLPFLSSISSSEYLHFSVKSYNFSCSLARFFFHIFLSSLHPFAPSPFSSLSHTPYTLRALSPFIITNSNQIYKYINTKVSNEKIHFFSSGNVDDAINPLLPISNSY